MEKDFLDGLLDIPDHFFAELTTAVQQPELTTAVQQSGLTTAVQQPELTTAVQQSGLTTAVQQPELTTAAVQPTPMTSGKRPCEALADVDGNVEIPPKQMRKKRAKKQAKVSSEPTGDIITIAEFEEEQNTTIMKEMCKDIKLVVRTMQIMEQTISNLQNKVEEMSMQQRRMVEAFNKHLQECGQQSNATQSTVAEQLPPYQPQLPAAEPFVSQPHLTLNTCPYTSLQLPVTQEGPTQQLPQPVDSPINIPLPIAPRNPRFAELPSSDIDRTKLKNVHDVLKKYSNLRVESKIGILAVKLAREAIFDDDVLRRCTPRGWNDMPALPQIELNYLKAALFGQFPRFWSCPEQFEKLWATAQESLAQACKRLRKPQ